MKDALQSEITFLKRYFPRFGVLENNIITPEKAKQKFLKGETYSLLFGDPTDPAYYITGSPSATGDANPGCSVNFLQDGKGADSYYLQKVPQAEEAGIGLFIWEYKSNIFDEAGRRAMFYPYRGLGDGDLPELEFNREIYYNISVPWQDFGVGPFPSFEELLDGTLVSRLPKITLPPKELLVENIPMNKQHASTPKRAPIGRFPW